MAPCRVTDMSGREVAVSAIELHGLRMRCNNGNVRVSRAWVCEGMSRGAAGEGPCNVRKWAAGGVRACSRDGLPFMRLWVGRGARMADAHVIRWRNQKRLPFAVSALRKAATGELQWRMARGHASDLTAGARGRATAMTCQYRAGRCATCPRTGEVPVPWAKKRLHFSCRLVDRKPVVRVGCFARGKVPPIRSSVAPLRKRRFRKSRQARPCRLHFDRPLIRAG